MEDAAVMAGLMAADSLFLFEDGDVGAGEVFLQTIGGCESDDATADDGDSVGAVCQDKFYSAVEVC